ncbi:MAG: DUF1016 family protein [Gemmataceae bacterium]|nr:DUF1016 family protein [Gemmataceae bacterium]
MPPRKKSLVKKTAQVSTVAPDPVKLLGELRTIIEAGRGAVAQAVNAGLVLLYWSVGDRIRRGILGESRGKYGEEIVGTVARQLTEEYGKGFSQRNLFNMIELAEAFPELRILQTLSAKLGWSHFLHLIPIQDPLKRDFYAEMCRLERWSVRTLRDKIRGMMYERTAIAKRPEKFIRAELDALRDEDRRTRCRNGGQRERWCHDARGVDRGALFTDTETRANQLSSTITSPMSGVTAPQKMVGSIPGLKTRTLPSANPTISPPGLCPLGTRGSHASVVGRT